MHVENTGHMHSRTTKSEKTLQHKKQSKTVVIKRIVEIGLSMKLHTLIEIIYFHIFEEDFNQLNAPFIITNSGMLEEFF